jgi:hypothetical protein
MNLKFFAKVFTKLFFFGKEKQKELEVLAIENHKLYFDIA